MTAAVLTGLIVVVGLLAVLVAGLLRSHADIIRALHDLGVNLDPEGEAADQRFALRPAGGAAARPGSGAPAVAITGVRPGTTENVHVSVAGRGRTLLAFLSSTCLTCRGFWEILGEPTTEIPGRARLVIVVQDPDAESPSALAELMAPHIVTVHSSAAWDAYAVPGAPYFVLIDGPTARVLGEGTATTWDHVRNLLQQALGDVMHRDQAQREADVDATLEAAGIGPDHPSLRPGSPP